MTSELSKVSRSTNESTPLKTGQGNIGTEGEVANFAANFFEENDLTMSFVDVVPGNLGEFSSRRCVFKKNDDDEWFLVPKGKLTDPAVNNRFSSSPANFKNEDEYFSALDSYKGEIDRLERRYLRDFFTDLDLNVPGNTKIRTENSQKDKTILQQVEVDISRFTKMIVNGRIIYEKKEDNAYGIKDFFAIYQVLLASFGNDENVTEMISKLLTQASLGRPIEILTKRYTNHFLSKVVTSAIFSNLQLHTNYSLANAKKNVIITLESVFALLDISQGEPSIVRYIKVVRVIKLDKKSLKDVLKVDGEIIDVYSPFYKNLKDANLYEVNLEKILNSSKDAGSCRIL